VTSLRERIEAKTRRTASLPILVGDATSATAAVTEALRLLQNFQAAAPDDPDEAYRAEEQRLREALQATLNAQAEMVLHVRLQALPADEWEAIFGPIEPDENGDISLDEVRATLLAASCVDEELRDEGWWEEQLARPEWSKGDKLAINQTLLDLNHSAMLGGSGKG
jgi:hypothetical protein